MDKSLLLKPRIATAEVHIPDVGTVTVRGLSRQEMLDAGNLAEQGVAVMERAMLSMGMVDPELTVDEVAEWQKASPANEIQPVVLKINELSGVAQGSTKEMFQGAGTES